MIQPTIDPVFSIPVYASGFDLSAQRKQEIIDTTRLTRIHSNDGYISENKYILSDPNYQDLSQIVNHHIDVYLHEILKYNKKYKFYITNSWLMKHELDDFANKHHHNHSLFSGVLYLQCDKSSGDIVFHKSPYHYSTLHTFDLEKDEYNIFNSESWRYTPLENQIIIFPSMLEHSVDPSKSKKPRYCIAFNTFVHGELGEQDNEKIGRLSL